MFMRLEMGNSSISFTFTTARLSIPNVLSVGKQELASTVRLKSAIILSTFLVLTGTIGSPS